MNLKTIKPSTRNADSLIINYNVLIHMVPEIGTKSVDYIKSMGLNMNQCYGIVIKNGVLKLGGKTFNATKVFLDSKSAVLNPDTNKHAVKILKAIPKVTAINKSSYLVIDHTITSKSTKFISDITTPKRGIIHLLEQLNRQYKFAKQRMSGFENSVMIIVDPIKIQKTKKTYSNIKLLEKLKMLDPKTSQLQCFDKYIFAVLHTSKGYRYVPIVSTDNDNNIIINKMNIAYIIKEFEKEYEKSHPDDITTISTETKPISSETKSLANSIDIQDDKLVVNSSKLNRILKKYNIDDPIIADQIQSHIESYLESNENIIDRSNLEYEIIKAINKLVHGTDSVKQRYLDDPAELFIKLQGNKNFKKQISYPVVQNHIYGDLNKVIDLKYVTAPIKKEVEFTRNIHTKVKELFSILEQQTINPIKVKKITHEVKDNNINRFIDYTITLQNLSNGNKKPYEVHLQIPSLVNDKYFKLNGKNYILANQIFFKPLTKTATDECRLLSNYAIVTLKVVNMQFNMSELENIIHYIQVTNSKLINEVRYDKDNNIIGVVFNDKHNSAIDLDSELVFQNDNELLIRNANQLKRIIDDKEEILEIGLYEYLYDKISEFINLDTNKLQYIRIHVGGIKLPLIMYLWTQIGLLNALQKCNIEYTIGEQPEHENVIHSIKLKNNKILFIYSDQRRKTLIVNGLEFLSHLKFSETELNDKTAIDTYLINKYGSRVIANLNLLTLNEIDPITKKLLKHESLPTDMINLTSTVMVDMLLNNQPTKLTDLSNYRVRQSEIMFNLMYKQISQAHSYYSQEAENNPDAKLFLTENYIIQCMLGVHQHTRGNTVLTLATPFNPLTEIKDDTKLIKTGPTGVPNKRSFNNAHRNIHESNIGNISANSTSESSDVGLVTHHSLTALMNNEYGIYGIRNIDKLNGWDVVGADEALIPFINGIDPQRAILATTHQGQVIPVSNGEPPIVTTGFNYTLPQISSSRFCKTAKYNGEVIDVEKDGYIKFKYSNGDVEIYDLTPRLSRNKRATYINISLNHLNKGDKFKKGELIAWSNAFHKETESFAPGKNIKFAIMNYMGFSYEDGYVVNENFTHESTVEVLRELFIIVPYNSKVNTVVTNIGHIEKDQTLVEFNYTNTIDDYLDAYNILGTDMGQEDIEPFRSMNDSVQLKACEGEIVHMRMYVNNTVKVDPKLIKVWKSLCTKLRKKKNTIASSYKLKDDKIKAYDNLDMSQLKVGIHKHNGVLFEGVKIVYYVKEIKSLEVGDKLSNRYGSKGVISKIIPDDKTPVGEFSGKIDAFIAPGGVLGRKNVSIIKEMYIGKIIYYLKEQLSQYAKQKSYKTNKLRKLIHDVYTALYGTNSKYLQNIIDYIDNLSESQLRKKLVDKKIHFTFIAQPFENLPFSNIKNAANILDIPLEEYITIPELGIKTKTKVPVGIHYMQALEQTAEDYMSIRSTGKYISVTGQPAKGKKNFGGQSVGELDTYAMLTYNNKNILKELMNTRSDNIRAKRKMINNIIVTGESDLPKIQQSNKGKTQDLFKIFMHGIGLKVT